VPAAGEGADGADWLAGWLAGWRIEVAALEWPSLRQFRQSRQTQVAHPSARCTNLELAPAFPISTLALLHPDFRSLSSPSPSPSPLPLPLTLAGFKCCHSSARPLWPPPAGGARGPSALAS